MTPTLTEVHTALQNLAMYNKIMKARKELEGVVA